MYLSTYVPYYMMNYCTNNGWDFFQLLNTNEAGAHRVSSWWKFGESILNKSNKSAHHTIERNMRALDLNVGLKLTSVFLQKLTVTKRGQQQLDKELWGCLLSWFEKILNGNETPLVRNSLMISSVRHTFSHEGSDYVHDICEVAAARCWFQ